METKHTPGPWKLDMNSVGLFLKGSIPVDGSGHDALAQVVWQMEDDADYGKNSPECEANARLIAAAPELLAALDRLLKAAPPGKMDDPMTFTRKNAEYILASSEARAAIAKATGSQP